MQYLNDVIGAPAGKGAPVLLSTLTSFVHFVLRGEVLNEVRPLFLVAKFAGCLDREEMEELLATRQLGYGDEGEQRLLFMQTDTSSKVLIMIKFLLN